MTRKRNIAAVLLLVAVAFSAIVGLGAAATAYDQKHYIDENTSVVKVTVDNGTSALDANITMYGVEDDGTETEELSGNITAAAGEENVTRLRDIDASVYNEVRVVIADADGGENVRVDVWDALGDRTMPVDNDTESVRATVENTTGSVDASVWGVDENGNQTGVHMANLTAEGANNTSQMEYTALEPENYTEYRVLVEGAGAEAVTIDKLQAITGGGALFGSGMPISQDQAVMGGGMIAVGYVLRRMWL